MRHGFNDGQLRALIGKCVALNTVRGHHVSLARSADEYPPVVTQSPYVDMKSEWWAARKAKYHTEDPE